MRALRKKLGDSASAPALITTEPGVGYRWIAEPNVGCRPCRRAHLPRSGSSSVVKRLLVGRAFASDSLEHTLLPKTLALPVFSSDALSSVAYATEEILKVLLIASIGTAHLVMPIAIAIALAHGDRGGLVSPDGARLPFGGGAYIVSKDNLGQPPGLVAASALLVDYMMTVVVSTVAGVFAIISAVPSLAPYRVEMSVSRSCCSSRWRTSAG